VPGITYLETPPGQKPRVVITADPELDDNNSLIRYRCAARTSAPRG
jgi:hypothetical protein